MMNMRMKMLKIVAVVTMSASNVPMQANGIMTTRTWHGCTAVVMGALTYLSCALAREEGAFAVKGFKLLPKVDGIAKGTRFMAAFTAFSFLCSAISNANKAFGGRIK